METKTKSNLSTMKKILSLMTLMALMFSVYTYAQEVLSHETPDYDDKYISYGPDQKSFWHLYLGYGGFADKGEIGAEINTWKSTGFLLGMRYKRKLSNTFSLGYDLSMQNNHFNIKQNSDKMVPNTDLNDREKLIFNNLGLEIYFRVNLTSREQKMGTYIDLGGYGNWSYRIRHETRNEASESDLHERMIVTNQKLKYTEPLHAGLRGRLGINRLALMAEYRLTNLFKTDYLFPELPKIQLSLQLGIH